jgi:proline dehydrogenase
VKYASRSYAAGDHLSDALNVERRLAARGLAATIGFWNTQQDAPRLVADQYLAGLDQLGKTCPSSYLSIKLPAIDFSTELLDEVSAHAAVNGVRLHLDAMWPQTAEQTRTLAERAIAVHGARGLNLSYTLPGRWRRSLDDADWAIASGVKLRVVKGQWADPVQPDRDPRAGFLEAIDRLAGRAAHVAVATHELSLAAVALTRLQAAGTSCELELLYGLPITPSLEQARRLGVSVRVYIPYGTAFLPYALSQMRRNPRIAWWMLRDMVLRRD